MERVLPVPSDREIFREASVLANQCASLQTSARLCKPAAGSVNQQTPLHLSRAFNFSTRPTATHHLSLHAGTCVCKAAKGTTSRHAPL
jgi:hypothetical protein